MKQKNIYSLAGLLILFLLNTLPGHAQKVTVSDEIPLRNDLSYDLIGQIDSNVILFRDRGTKFELRIFDKNLRHREDREIALADKNCDILASLPGDTCFFLFYSFRHRGNFYIEADQFSSTGNLLSSDTVKVFEDVLFNPEIRVSRSENRSKILFFCVHQEHELQSVMFDIDTRKTLFDRKLFFKDTELREDFRSMLVTDKGDQIAIFEKDNFRSKKDRHIFEVYRFNNSSEAYQSFAIPMFRYVSFHSKFVYDNVNDQLIGGGIFTQKNLNKAEGLYYIQHSLRTGDSERLTTHSFESKYDEEIKRRSSEKNEFNQLEITDIALKQGGGVVLITEIKKEFERRATYGTTSNRNVGLNPFGFRAPLLVDYYYEDLAIFSLDKNGNLLWSDILHKKQYSHDDDGMYSSFFLFKNPSKLRLVYNDEISTENTVSEYIVQPNGQYQRKSVLSTEYVRLQLRFRDAVQISSNAFIVPSQRSMRLNLVKVEYL